MHLFMLQVKDEARICSTEIYCILKCMYKDIYYIMFILSYENTLTAILIIVSLQITISLLI